MEQGQFIKGSLTTIILKLLEDKGRMYGYEMTRSVREVTKGKINITEAALYPALHKLVAEDMLETSSEMVEGRLRKYYSLTKKGKTETSSQVNALLDALSSVQMLLNTKLGHG